MKRVAALMGLSLLLTGAAEAAPKPFPLEEATIAGIQKAILSHQVTCRQIVQRYFARIKAYGGQCVGYGKPDLVAPSGKPIQLHAVTPIAGAHAINAFSNLNIRGQRSETDLADRDPSKPDALEAAAALDRYFARTGKLAGPLHCVAVGVKDEFDTADMRTTDGAYLDFANDRPPRDAGAVARLRAAGAIIIGKTNMGDYARSARSSYGGQVCNAYATDRDPGASSSGSAAATAANLTTTAIGEETLGSVLDPARRNGVVGIVPTYGLITRDGMWRANLLRERVGPFARTVQDAARMLDALVGYDPKDPLTAVAVGKVPQGGYAVHAASRSLAGKRIGVIRELMVEFTPADRDSIRVANEAIRQLRAAGATVLESVNARDIAKFGAVDDPSIPNLKPGVQEAIAELLPVTEPALDRILPNHGFAFPKDEAPLDYALKLSADPSLFPEEINIRALNNTPQGEYNETKFTLSRYLRDRGDARIRDVSDLKPHSLGIADGVTLPGGGDSLDTQGETALLYRKQALQQILLKVMADNHLDALVYPLETVPPAIIGAPTEPDADNRPYRGWNTISDVSGLPAIQVPAGFTREVYDRDPKDPARLLPPKQVSLPMGLTFLGRPFDEAGLLEIASAFEYRTHHRKPPADFPELAEAGAPKR